MTNNYGALIKGTLGAHQTQQWHYTILSAVHRRMPDTSVGICFLTFNGEQHVNVCMDCIIFSHGMYTTSDWPTCEH